MLKLNRKDGVVIKNYLLILIVLLLNTLNASDAISASNDLSVTAKPVLIGGKISGFHLQISNLSPDAPYVVRVNRQLLLNFSVTAATDEGVNLVKPRIASAINYGDKFGYHYDSILPPLSSITFEVPLPPSTRLNYTRTDKTKVKLSAKFLYQKGIQIDDSPIEFKSDFEFLGILKIVE